MHTMNLELRSKITENQTPQSNTRDLRDSPKSQVTSTKSTRISHTQSLDNDLSLTLTIVSLIEITKFMSE
ncbi:unnamed protein product [Camellia sinensis]